MGGLINMLVQTQALEKLQEFPCIRVLRIVSVDVEIACYK